MMAWCSERVVKIIEILNNLYPEATTALYFENPFQLLVATILSAQCTDKQVNKITANLFKKYKKPEDFTGLSPGWLAEEIKGCGFYRNKSKNIVATSKVLVEKYNSQVPATREELEKLPGVGRKTANVVLNVAFGQPVLPVDTHVLRVARRLGLAKRSTPEEVEKELMECIPLEYRRDFHHQLIAHGRKICTAKRPKCEICRLIKLCPAVSPSLGLEHY